MLLQRLLWRRFRKRLASQAPGRRAQRVGHAGRPGFAQPRQRLAFAASKLHPAAGHGQGAVGARDPGEMGGGGGKMWKMRGLRGLGIKLYGRL